MIASYTSLYKSQTSSAFMMWTLKSLFFICLFVATISLSAQTRKVTFKLDATELILCGFNPDSDTLRVNIFIGKTSDGVEGLPMKRIGKSSLYELTRDVQPGKVEWKFRAYPKKKFYYGGYEQTEDLNNRVFILGKGTLDTTIMISTANIYLEKMRMVHFEFDLDDLLASGFVDTKDTIRVNIYSANSFGNIDGPAAVRIPNSTKYRVTRVLPPGTVEWKLRGYPAYRFYNKGYERMDQGFLENRKFRLSSAEADTTIQVDRIFLLMSGR
ncbi:MAG: hypothetical protein SFU91_01280 [Chloroherpetonaceae bacterium]|nr:hypothetical protein [Chloroherpetonaceae bacterium]